MKKVSINFSEYAPKAPEKLAVKNSTFSLNKAVAMVATYLYNNDKKRFAPRVACLTREDSPEKSLALADADVLRQIKDFAKNHEADDSWAYVSMVILGVPAVGDLEKPLRKWARTNGLSRRVRCIEARKAALLGAAAAE